jgi:hypothetical protein
LLFESINKYARSMEVLRRDIAPISPEKRNRLWCGGVRAVTSSALPAQEAAEILEKRMAAELMAMPLQDALPITRACGHYLNLTGIAEIHHRCSACSHQWVWDGTHTAQHALQRAQQYSWVSSLLTSGGMFLSMPPLPHESVKRGQMH